MGMTVHGGNRYSKVWINGQSTLKDVSELVADKLKYDLTDVWSITCRENGALHGPAVELEIRAGTWHGDDAKEFAERLSKQQR